MHYPPWTRDLIIANITQSLNDGATFTLEQNEIMDVFMNDMRREWLKPYYDWKEDLSRFGLTRKLGKWAGQFFYTYSQNDNLYAGAQFGIRERGVVKLT